MAAQEPDPQKRAVAYDAALVRRIWVYVRPHQKLIWISLALLLLASGLRLGLPYLVKIAIDRHLVAKQLEGAAPLIGLFLVLAVGEFFVRRLQVFVVDKAGQNALFDLRVAVFRHLQRLRASYYDRTPIGRLVGRVTTDIEALQEMFSSGVVTVLGDFIYLFATLAILLSLNWKLTLVAMLVVPVLFGLTLLIRTQVRKSYVQLRERLSQMNAFLHENISGMPLVQMFVREGLTRQEFGDINQGVRGAQLNSVKWESILSALMEMLGSFTLAVILWYGGRIALEGANVPMDGVDPITTGLTIGTLFAFVDYMQKFFAPLNDLSLKYTVMQNAMTASSRIFALLDVDEVIPEATKPVQLPAAQGKIRFNRVHFAYHPEDPILQDIRFSVNPGEKIAVVGATGAGKTTLLKILTRLYDIQSGSIQLDGVDIREYGLRELRSRVGIVPQDVFLFEGDILGNIRLGKPQITDTEALAAAKRLGLDDFVARFPGGYYEPVKERGKNLSAGEKQLIAFARVLAAAPPVLVLDEATSNVDSHTEHLLQQALHELMRGRTSLVIAHRLSTIQDADRILVLHKGRLVEEGTHDDLLSKRAYYWRLHQMQYKDQIS